MKIEIVKTSISLEREVLEKAREKVVHTGQSVSSYINVLLRRDLGVKRNGKTVKETA